MAGYQIFKVGNKQLKIISPTKEIMYEAQEVYMETLTEAIENDILNDKDVEALLRDRGMWSDYDENQINNVLPKHIEHWKVEIFRNFKNKKERALLEKHLHAARVGLSDMLRKRHIYDHYTQHGLATFARWQKIIESCTVNLDGSKYDWAETNVNAVLDFIGQNIMSESTVRELARTEPWRSIWMTGKNINNLFGCPSIDLSDEQRRLVRWSSLYDNVSEYQDCPSEDIIAHDDAFDGWLTLKNREQEKAKKDSEMKGRAGKGIDAPEVMMVMPTDPDELADIYGSKQGFIESVYGMNDPTARMIANNRLKTVEKLGTAHDTDFADVQRGITREIGKRGK